MRRMLPIALVLILTASWITAEATELVSGSTELMATVDSPPMFLMLAGLAVFVYSLFYLPAVRGA